MLLKGQAIDKGRGIIAAYFAVRFGFDVKNVLFLVFVVMSVFF